MKKLNVVFLVLIFAVSLFVYGCSNSTDPGDTGTLGKVSMTVVYTPLAVSGLQKSGSVNAVDSIKITRVRVVLRNIKLKAEDYNEVEMEHEENGINSTKKLAPFVLDLNLSGAMQQISISNIPFGTYNRFEFQIHKVSQSEIDTLSASQKATFADFLSGDRFSIIIDGNLYKNGQSTATAFTYKSRINVEFEKTLSPNLVISQTQTTFNLTLQISSAGWFLDQNKSLLDPTNPNNFSVIENNLKSFLKAFKDNNKDGKEDSN